MDFIDKFPISLDRPSQIMCITAISHVSNLPTHFYKIPGKSLEVKVTNTDKGRLWHFNNISITVILNQTQCHEDLSFAVIMSAVF